MRTPDRYRILQLGDPRLRVKSVEVQESEFGSATEQIVKRLTFVNKITSNAVGVCAPQLGDNRRILVWDIPEQGEGHIINPVIEETDGEITVYEGCLSIPDMWFEISRPKSLQVVGQNVGGDEVRYDADDLFARLILHEQDHLDGVLMIDRLNDDQWRDFTSEWDARNGPGSCAPDWRQELG